MLYLLCFACCSESYFSAINHRRRLNHYFHLCAPISSTSSHTHSTISHIIPYAHLSKSVPPIGRNGAHLLTHRQNTIDRRTDSGTIYTSSYWCIELELSNIWGIYSMCLFTFDLFIWFCFSTSPLNTRIKYEKSPKGRDGLRAKCSTT